VAKKPKATVVAAVVAVVAVVVVVVPPSVVYPAQVVVAANPQEANKLYSGFVKELNRKQPLVFRQKLQWLFLNNSCRKKTKLKQP
jgi:hypothetical protein